MIAYVQFKETNDICLILRNKGEQTILHDDKSLSLSYNTKVTNQQRLGVGRGEGRGRLDCDKGPLGFGGGDENLVIFFIKTLKINSIENMLSKLK